jgi:diguanylate cyclase (GGDEF)-like protein
LPDVTSERARDVAAEVQRAAMQIENLITDLGQAAHLPRLRPARLGPADPANELDGLRELVEASQQRCAALESELNAARDAQQQLQTYADDFRRIYAESRQRLQQMTALYEVSTAIGATVDPQAVLARIIEGLGRLLPDAELAVYLLEDGGQLARREAATEELDEALAPATASLGEGIVGRAIATTRPEVEGAGAALVTLRKLALPLLAGPRVVGALLVARRGQPFAAEERQVAGMVATQAAMALQNARLATTDALTGLYNRRYFEQALAFECERARRIGRPIGLVIADVDHFKAFNEQYGHPAGDAVLREVAATLARQLRRTDIVARIGGEEFAAILPEDDLGEVAIAAERLREAVEQRPPLEFDGQVLPPVRVSVGGASLGGEAAAPPILIRTADDALRQAKRGGRNRSLVVGSGAEADRAAADDPDAGSRLSREAQS